MLTSPSRIKLTVVCAALACANGGGVLGADAGAEALEERETKAALVAATARLAKLEASVGGLRASNEALTLALAEANLEVTENRSEAELAVKSLEALGVDLLSGADGLAGRLLKAANNLRLADEENERLRSHLVQMSEAVVPFIGESVAGGEDTVKTLRAAASRAGRALERGIGSSGLPFNEESSRQTKIVGLKPDLGLVVVDSGGEMGLREGAPLRIYRGEDVIATALVVEVRPRVSGAILTGDNANSDAVAIGDTARLNLVNSFKN